MAQINDTSSKRLKIGWINSDTAKSIGIADATDYFQVISIPWNSAYPSQLLLTASGKQRMYYRTCSNGTWQTPHLLTTMDDLSVIQTNFIARNDNLFEGDNGCAIYRMGKIRIARFYFSKSLAVNAGGFYPLGTLENQDIPSISTYVLCGRTDGNTNNLSTLAIDNAGEVSLRPLTPFSSGVVTVANATWIAK